MRPIRLHLYQFLTPCYHFINTWWLSWRLVFFRADKNEKKYKASLVCVILGCLAILFLEVNKWTENFVEHFNALAFACGLSRDFAKV